MKIFNLFLILNVVICAGGLCTTPIASAATNDDAMESCHSMDHSAQAGITLNIEQENNNKSGIDSTCCSEYLTNNLSDQFVKVTFKEALRFSTYTSALIQNKKIDHISQREHGPPDLEVLNSTFLI